MTGRDLHPLALTLALALIVCHGCFRVGPDYVEPEPQVPDAWHEAATEGLADGEASIQTWWVIFEDPVLADLIERAEASNLNLQESLYRIQASRALRGIAAGRKVPALEGFGSYDRAKFSENALAPGDGEPTDIWALGAGATWELDVFGRIARSVEAATARMEASVEDYRDVLVSVLAEVAETYIDIRTFQARIDYAEDNVEAQEQTLQLTRDRFSAGLVSQLDVAQAESILADTRSEIPFLEESLEIAFNRLAVLLGENAGSLQGTLGGERGAIPVPPATVTTGLPADLLRQRPDIRRSERELASQTALVGVATADLYPSFGLSGVLQLEALDFADLGDASSITWSLGGAFRWNLFAGGRIRSRISFEEARTSQALASYEQTVLLAVEEVEDALVSYRKEWERRDRLIEAVDATQRSLDLVLTQYREGLTNFQNVLDTQRSLFGRQDRLADSEGEVVQNLVALYRSLGGGWDPEADIPVPALTSAARTSEAGAAGSSSGGSQP